MKRTNVILDEELLEKARRASGQRTYSAAINEALAEYVRKRDFWTAYRKFAEEARQMHYGEKSRRNIYGEASNKEAKDLADEGIEVARIPWMPRHDS